MRKSDSFLLSLFFCLFLLIATVIDSNRLQVEAISHLERSAQLVAQHGLTDLALFTEARYTRHISQSDLHSAFQDHPMALEHFPSGSIYLPPQVSSQ